MSKNKNAVFFCSFSALIFLRCIGNFASTETYSLKVIVTDENGNAISGATVFLADQDTAAISNDAGIAQLQLHLESTAEQNDEAKIYKDGYFYEIVALTSYDTSLAVSLMPVLCPTAGKSSLFTLISPNGGEVFYTGDTIFVIGQKAEIDLNVQVDFLSEAYPVYNIYGLEPWSGQKDTLAFLVVTDTLPESAQYRVTMQKYNSSGQPNCCSTSKCYFAIRHR